jgi:transposase
MVIDEQALSELDAEQLRQVSQRLLAELRHQRALNEKLAYECALLKRLKFAAKSERHSAEQRNLLEEELDSDLAAVEHEIEQLRPTQPVTDKQQPKRTPLPANLPRHEIRQTTGSGAGRQVCRPPALESPGNDLWARWPGHRQIDPGAMGG